MIDVQTQMMQKHFAAAKRNIRISHFSKRAQVRDYPNANKIALWSLEDIKRTESMFPSD